MIYLIFSFIFIAIIYLYFRKVWFYRHPLRYASERDGVIISPADGQVVYIRQFADGVIVSEKMEERISLSEIVKTEGWPAQGWIIGIYMSPFDVHYNYAPIKATVKKMAYIKSRLNLPMLDLLQYIRIALLRRSMNILSNKFHVENERNIIFLEGDLKVLVVEIADKFVNKIRPLVREGMQVEAGDEIGFIDRGSQVDLIIFSKDIEIVIKFREQLFGGKTVIGRYKEASPKIS